MCVCDQDTEETVTYFLKWCRDLNSIGERHGVREEGQIEQLLLFSEPNNSEINERKKHLEREVEVAAGCGVTEACGGGLYRADTASPRADINVILGVFIKSSTYLGLGMDFWRVYL